VNDETRAGHEHLSRREPSQAAAAFRLALGKDPQDAEAREGLARALLALGDAARALVELEMLAKVVARASAERLRSEVLMKLGRYDEAVTHLRRAMELEQLLPPAKRGGGGEGERSA
jgi:Flp pilus assembly protein TadD